ncbi:MAG TPA: sigma-70 family RNA polymerase sigma factor [Terriglobia bacterium]|nr:sigma-70 family RNA polymerase sigma factor [Terriglobia bacterium]
MTSMLQVVEGAIGDDDRRAASAALLEDFDSVVLQHQQRIHRVLLGMLRDSDAAQTLTQECFLRAYESRGRYRGEASVSTWLIRIAINLAHDYHRNRRLGFWRRLFAGDNDVGEMAARLPSDAATPEQDLLAKEKLAAVWSAVERLAPQQRAVFVLRFVEQLSLEEIAAATNLKLGTVKAHLFRALGTVRKRMKEWQVSP